MDRKLKIAIYMRLSKETSAGNAFPSQEECLLEESNSIRMQRTLLREYAAAHFTDYELLEFEDDGYSGTNFNRPGAARLLELVRGMEVDCIIVKDFSRFSRDYIELGAYMEQIFPFMGVRFISVNDGYDSAEKRYVAGELDISFKNLLYDLYSKDLSVKVRSSLAARKAKGQYISTNSPFGYRKAADDRHMLVIEEDEAEIVRRIFDLTLQGYTSAEIAKLFNEEGIKTPLQFGLEKGRGGRTPKRGLFIWQSSTVCQILRNQAYAGDIIYGKTEKAEVGGRNRLKPRSQWKVCRDHHAPIIERQIFEMVQESRGKKKRGSTGKTTHPLTGKLVCGCCGRNLCIRKGAQTYFTCPCLYVGGQAGCVRKADALCLEQSILQSMQAYVLRAAGEEALRNRYRKALKEELEECDRKIQEAHREETVLKKRKAEAYEAYAAGNMDAAAYQAVSAGTLEREKALKEELAEAGKRTAVLREKAEGSQRMEAVMSGLGLGQLTGQNVSELIDEVAVYSDQSLEIHWRENAGIYTA